MVFDNASYTSRVVIDRFVKFIVGYYECKICRRGSYFKALHLLCNSILVLNPTVNFKIYRVLLGEIKAKSGQKSHR